MLKPLITIDNWDNGMSLNDRVASKGQLARGSGLEQFLRNGYLANRVGVTRLTLSSSVDVNVVFNDILYSQEASTVYLAGGDTIIYSQNSSGTIASARDSAQAGGIRSLIEYKGYMYYPQDTTIGRSDLAGSPTYTDNWQASNIQNVAYKPLVVGADNNLYIGNGQYVAKWDDSTFTYNAFDMGTGWEVQCMANFDSPLLAIGANFGSSTSGINSTQCKIFLWNKTEPFIAESTIDIPEASIFAMISRPNGLWVWAGTNSVSIYYCPSGSRQPIKVYTFENDNPDDYQLQVFPNAVTVNEGRIVFGLTFNSSASNQFVPGIYSFNPELNNFRLMCERGIVAGVTGQVNIKSLRAIRYTGQPSMLYFSYENGTTQNIYREQLFSSDSNTFSSNGSFSDGTAETLYFDAPAGKKLYFDGFGMDFLPLTSSAGISLEYKKDAETSYTAVKSVTGSGTEIGFYKTQPVEAYTIKFRITISSTSTRTFIKRFFATGKLIDDTR